MLCTLLWSFKYISFRCSNAIGREYLQKCVAEKRAKKERKTQTQLVVLRCMQQLLVFILPLPLTVCLKVSLWHRFFRSDPFAHKRFLFMHFCAIDHSGPIFPWKLLRVFVSFEYNWPQIYFHILRVFNHIHTLHNRFIAEACHAEWDVIGQIESLRYDHNETMRICKHSIQLCRQQSTAHWYVAVLHWFGVWNGVCDCFADRACPYLSTNKWHTIESHLFAVIDWSSNNTDAIDAQHRTQLSHFNWQRPDQQNDQNWFHSQSVTAPHCPISKIYVHLLTMVLSSI